MQITLFNRSIYLRIGQHSEAGRKNFPKIEIQKNNYKAPHSKNLLYAFIPLYAMQGKYLQVWLGKV